VAVENTVVDEAVEEKKLAETNIQPLLEGLRDYARVDLKPETAEIVNAAIQEHERRLALLQIAIAANQALLDDGYPLLPVHEVEQAVYADLQEQFISISAAFGHFTPNMAAELGLFANGPEPKS